MCLIILTLNSNKIKIIKIELYYFSVLKTKYVMLTNCILKIENKKNYNKLTCGWNNGRRYRGLRRRIILCDF